MLALAAPALHGHSSSHSAPVAAGKTPIVRSKPAARRAPSSTSLSSAALASFSDSSASLAPSSSSSSSTAVSSSASRTIASVSHFPSEPSLAAKRDPHSPASSRPKLVESETLSKVIRPSTSSMPVAAPAEYNSTSDLQSYPTPDLLRLLASLLTQIATANDGLSASPSHNASSSNSQSFKADHSPFWQSLFTASRAALSTPTSPLTFHARNVPSITLQAYLLRILRYCPTTNEVFLSLLVYFDRMSKLAQEATGSRFVIDSYNIHRLVIAGVTVASKFFSDVFYTNSRYAKVGGLPQAELNQLELQFLLLNDFRLAIPPEEMQRYWGQLMRFSQRQAEADGSQNQTALLPGPSTVVSRPLQSMGAFDAYGGVMANDSLSSSSAQAQRNSTPKRYRSGDVPLAPCPPPEEQEEREQESICSETDTDAETDDEPTIRPAHSCASSDTQSLFSNDASEDDLGDDTDDDGTRNNRLHNKSVRPPHHRWSSTASSAESSVDGDRFMSSP